MRSSSRLERREHFPNLQFSVVAASVTHDGLSNPEKEVTSGSEYDLEILLHLRPDAEICDEKLEQLEGWSWTQRRRLNLSINVIAECQICT